MHRATERRWANVCIFALGVALLCQILGFVLPAWVRLDFTINTTRYARDYSLWYMTQCKNEWVCSTRSYYQLYDWTRNEIMFDGIPLDISFYKIHDSQVFYCFGLLGTMIGLYPLWKRRQVLVSKRAKGDPTRTGFIIAGALSSISGLFVMIASGLIGAAGDKARSQISFNVYRPTGLGLAAAGGALSFITGLVIFGRIVLKKYCPDCVSVSREIDVITRETGNQVDVMVYAETAE